MKKQLIEALIGQQPLSVVQPLLEGQDLTEKTRGRNLLHLAVQDGGNIDVVRFLHEQGVPINETTLQRFMIGGLMSGKFNDEVGEFLQKQLAATV